MKKFSRYFISALCVVTISSGMCGAAAQQQAIVPLEELRQQAMHFKQDMLTASEDERDVLLAEFGQILNSFDGRIARLQSNLEQHGDELLPNASRYADSLLEILSRERGELLQDVERINTATGREWDHAVHSVLTSYDNFYDTWDDIEAQFGKVGE